MSTAATLAPESTHWRSRARAVAVDAFLARQRGPLEDRLAEEARSLVKPLGALTEVLAQALGTEGRGGSRWRPLLTLAVAESCDGALDVAVAVELTHTASLVLDDLPCMDDAELRRGRPATHHLVGSAGAILLAVGLLARASELLGRQPRCGGALAEEWGRSIGFAGMAGGQAMDVAGASRLRGAERRLHRAKSAALPDFALSSAARIAGAPETTRVALAAFGRGLGWAYQLLDDVEDEAEDARHSRPAPDLPLSQSARIIRGAHRRLDAAGVDPRVREILSGLAQRVVPGPVAEWTSARVGRTGRL